MLDTLNMFEMMDLASRLNVRVENSAKPLHQIKINVNLNKITLLAVRIEDITAFSLCSCDYAASTHSLLIASYISRKISDLRVNQTWYKLDYFHWSQLIQPSRV